MNTDNGSEYLAKMTECGSDFFFLLLLSLFATTKDIETCFQKKKIFKLGSFGLNPFESNRLELTRIIIKFQN